MENYKVEVVSSSSGSFVVGTAEPVASVLDLKRQLKFSGDLVFTGGKKLNDSEAIPYDLKGFVKCRAIGKFAQSVQTKERVEPKQTAEALKSETGSRIETTSSDTTDSTDSVIIKGLLRAPPTEVRIRAKPFMTFSDLKKEFVAHPDCEVSDFRGVQFLGKGGSQPVDSDLLPSGPMVLRAFRNERGDSEIRGKQDLIGIKDRIDKVDKNLQSILKGHVDPNRVIVETRRLKDELTDSISWLDDRDISLKERAEMLLRSISDAQTRQ